MLIPWRYIFVLNYFACALGTLVLATTENRHPIVVAAHLTTGFTGMVGAIWLLRQTGEKRKRAERDAIPAARTEG